ncbi:MAG: NBR1-Ig-like domain-containing protein [Anaerolineales bacterium]|nr:NBR1-Ig-like domain-containing protein [Anaerolineales bacterium]
MKKPSMSAVSLLVVAMLLLAACNFPGYQAAQGDPVATSAAATVDAALQLTQLAVTLVPPTLVPTVPPPTEVLASPTPPPPTAVPPTATPSTPCNAASFVTDVNYPDSTQVVVNTNFTKTWRLKNVGTCSWTSGYKLVFDSGDRMGAPDSVTLTSGTVAPGSTVDVSVDLTAPNSSGTYQGNFRLKEPGGVLFGIGPSAANSFWVKIKAVTAASIKPDLVVKSITLDPESPFMSQSVSVSVKIKNQGGEIAKDFTVKWWPGESYPSAACSWDVDDLEPDDDQTLNCTYVGYPSWYSSINTKAEVDTDDDVDESDEGNNVRMKEVVVKNL